MAKDPEVKDSVFSDFTPRTRRVEPSSVELIDDPRAVIGEILSSEEYRLSLIQRAADGTLPPAIEKMFWEMFYGKAPDKHEVTITDTANLTELSDEELIARHEKAIQTLRAARALRQSAGRVITNPDHKTVM